MSLGCKSSLLFFSAIFVVTGIPSIQYLMLVTSAAIITDDLLKYNKIIHYLQ
jgi:hypothetical protein